MNKQAYQFNYEVYRSIDDLNQGDASLLRKAREVTGNAYAPYSSFHVGAVALLENGETVSGSNQENASFPVGLCAERVLLSTAASLYPKAPINTIAISYNNLKGESKRPISPCGVCRQSLLEYESMVKHPIRLILGGMEGEIFIIEKAGMLLPLSFTAEDME